MKHTKLVCNLKSCFFCTRCQPAWLPALEANRRVVTYKRGVTLFEEGKPMEHMYFINSGLVKVHKQWGDKELIVRFATSGDIAGHRGLGEDSVYPVSGTALEQTNVCLVDIDFFMDSLRVNPDLLMDLLMFFAAELKLSERKMRNMVHMSVKGRIAQAMLALEQKFGINKAGQINIQLSRQDFASFAGTTYETSFRVMQDMEKDKWIRMDGKMITLLHRENLLMLTRDTA
ncbi:MAG TPA: Crp/Fnr family transcriptional regulator [Phnomibacter sp.]|nr:Crp/Fnr family transcriptional regulator [Phnomibacter sp.]